MPPNSHRAGVTLAVIALLGCATGAPDSSLDALEHEQRRQLYKRCVSEQMKIRPFGSGMTVHQMCLRWAHRV